MYVKNNLSSTRTKLEAMNYLQKSTLDLLKLKLQPPNISQQHMPQEGSVGISMSLIYWQMVSLTLRARKGEI